LLPRWLFTYVASAIENRASKPAIAAFSARVAYKMPSYNKGEFFASICRGNVFSFEEVKAG
jgi:hypothetical protein